MYSTFHTIEWDVLPEFSEEKLRYFSRKIDGSIVGENATAKGVEYYACSDYQMRNRTLGIYLGCVKVAGDVPPRRLVADHEHEVEHSFSVNDQEYL